MAKHLAILLSFLFPLAACGNLGPDRVAQGRVDYASATAESAKQQALLNVIRLRYGDNVSFFRLGQVVSGYTLATEGRADLSLYTEDWSVGEVLGLGAVRRFEDRPTITYEPVIGPEFTRSMLSPLPPGDLFLMLAAGFPADLVLGLVVQSVEGLPNGFSGGVPLDQAIQFAELVRLLDRARGAGLLSVRRDDVEQGVVVLELRDGDNPSSQEVVERLRELLGGGEGTLRVVYGTDPGSPRELAVQTRSPMDVLAAIGSRIEVPDAHVTSGRTPATIGDPAGVGPVTQVRIRSSELRPLRAYASVSYGGRWFWIDEEDYSSKRAFTFLLLLLTSVESASPTRPPLVIIPTG
jgi:hypothetical protein